MRQGGNERCQRDKGWNELRCVARKSKLCGGMDHEKKENDFKALTQTLDGGKW